MGRRPLLYLGGGLLAVAVLVAALVLPRALSRRGEKAGAPSGAQPTHQSVVRSILFISCSAFCTSEDTICRGST